jgi:hypothetical protein
MKIETVPILDVSFHPVVKDLPPAPEELIQSLIVDLEDRPKMTPLLVDEKLRIIDVDSGDRLKAALKLDFLEVPVIRRPNNETFSSVVASIVCRRNYTKSAVAYLAYPLLEPLISERRGRPNCARRAQLSRTTEEAAASLGISRRLLVYAKQVHDLFRKHPHTREIIEPRILAAEDSISLGYAINGIAGLIHTKGKSRGNTDQLELFEMSLVKSARYIRDWTNLSETKKRHAVAHYTANFLPSLPPEFHRAHERFWREHKTEMV